MSGPILINHDQNQIIGRTWVEGTSLHFEFFAGHELTHEQLCNVFGGLGYRITKTEGDKVKAGVILEFSYQPQLMGKP